MRTPLQRREWKGTREASPNHMYVHPILTARQHLLQMAQHRHGYGCRFSMPVSNDLIYITRRMIIPKLLSISLGRQIGDASREFRSHFASLLYASDCLLNRTQLSRVARHRFPRLTTVRYSSSRSKVGVFTAEFSPVDSLIAVSKSALGSMSL